MAQQLEELWLEYRRALSELVSSEEEMDEHRKSFYAGACALNHLILRKKDLDTQALLDELSGFISLLAHPESTRGHS